MRFVDQRDGHILRVNDSTFKSLTQIGGTVVSDIALEDVESGIDQKYTFDEFNNYFELDNTYSHTLVRVELVMNDGSVKASDVYMDTIPSPDDCGKYTIYVNEYSPFDDSIDYAVVSYIKSIEYGSFMGLKPIKINGVYHMYSGMNIDDTYYLSGGNTEFGVIGRRINNPFFSNYFPSYKDVAKYIRRYDVTILMAQSFTPWGVIPMLYIYRANEAIQAFTVFGNRLLPIVNLLDVYDIAGTELVIDIDDEKDIVSAAETGIKMFNEWAYDYSFFIEPIHKYFEK